jgi:hypothetical protein
MTELLLVQFDVAFLTSLLVFSRLSADEIFVAFLFGILLVWALMTSLLVEKRSARGRYPNISTV